MKILALIPARGGSKRIPEKNKRVLGSSPLVVWSIDAARGIPEISDTLVSTDDEDLVAIARGAGAMAPWLRPADLATDTASSLDVCLHALDWYEGEKGPVDGLLVLQPTSPFRRRASVLRGIELFGAAGPKPVVGISMAHSHPLWCFRLDDERMIPYVDGGGLDLRSQDLPSAYVINGAFYLVAPSRLRATRSFFGEDMIPLQMLEPGEDVDIDTQWDWNVAEKYLELIGQEYPGL